MTERIEKTHDIFTSTDKDFSDNLKKRYRTANFWHIVLQASTVVGIVVLMALLLNIIDGAFGYVAIQNNVDPDELAVDGVAVENLPKETLIAILQNNISKGLFRRFESEVSFEDRTKEDVYNLVYERVIEPEVVQTWRLFDSIFHRQ